MGGTEEERAPDSILRNGSFASLPYWESRGYTSHGGKTKPSEKKTLERSTSIIISLTQWKFVVREEDQETKGP